MRSCALVVQSSPPPCSRRKWPQQHGYICGWTWSWHPQGRLGRCPDRRPLSRASSTRRRSWSRWTWPSPPRPPAPPPMWPCRLGQVCRAAEIQRWQPRTHDHLLFGEHPARKRFKTWLKAFSATWVGGILLHLGPLAMALLTKSKLTKIEIIQIPFHRTFVSRGILPARQESTRQQKITFSLETIMFASKRLLARLFLLRRLLRAQVVSDYLDIWRSGDMDIQQRRRGALLALAGPQNRIHLHTQRPSEATHLNIAT